MIGQMTLRSLGRCFVFLSSYSLCNDVGIEKLCVSIDMLFLEDKLPLPLKSDFKLCYTCLVRSVNLYLHGGKLHEK
ncbi:hypothetical protein BKA63DRAFT_9451 [Paraphoma chrysanthemicola]|nr:hypothetical protein BKA63DRAFT_9451 [Paraphoma chrysanthemicola]